jgi:hypothetical protein
MLDQIIDICPLAAIFLPQSLRHPNLSLDLARWPIPKHFAIAEETYFLRLSVDAVDISSSVEPKLLLRSIYFILYLRSQNLSSTCNDPLNSSYIGTSRSQTPFGLSYSAAS